MVAGGRGEQQRMDGDACTAMFFPLPSSSGARTPGTRIGLRYMAISIYV